MCLCLRNTTNARVCALLSLRERTIFSLFLSRFFLFFLSLSLPRCVFYALPLLLLMSSRSEFDGRIILVDGHRARSLCREYCTSASSSSGHHRVSVQSCPSSSSPFFCLPFSAVFDEKPRQVKLLMLSQRMR